MKKLLNKTILAIVIALAMVATIVGGVFLVRNQAKGVASAAEAGTTVKFETETTSFSPGTEFDMTITVETTRTNSVFSTVSFFIGPRKNSNHGVVDETKRDYLTFTLTETTKLFPNAIPNNKDNNNPAAANCKTRLSVGFASMASDNVKGSAAPIVFAKVHVKISESVPLADVEDDALTYSIGIIENPKNCYVDFNDASDTPGGALTVVPLEFKLKAPSDVNDLKTLKVGQGDDTGEYQNIDLSTDSDETDTFAATVTVTDPSIDIGVFFECAEDGENATITVDPGSKTGKSGDTVKVTVAAVESNGNKIVIKVKAENGDIKTYTVNVTVLGGMLTDIKIDSATKGESGVSAKFEPGVAFASDKTEYTVLVPSDIKKAKITATVSTGHNESEDLPVAFTGTAKKATAGNTVESGKAFEVIEIGEGDTLTITVEAPDASSGKIQKVYTLTFKIVDTDASLDHLEVKGQTKSTIFKNSTTKASEKGIYGYYKVVGEPNNESKVGVYPTSSKAKVMFDGSDLATTTKANVALGDHTIKVIAEAENFTEYKITLAKYSPLELVDGSDFDFIYEKVELDDDSADDPEDYLYSYYRRTYEEDGLVHGIDDVDFEKLVIGQVEQYMCIDDFITNFKNTNNIKFYLNYFDSYDLVYENGAVTSDFEDDSSDPDMYAISTGSYIEYYVDGVLEETIYISVLGDLDGDGYAGSSDISTIGEYLAGTRFFDDKVEVRLAGYLRNNGALGMADITEISDISKGNKQPSDFWYKG